MLRPHDHHYAIPVCPGSVPYLPDMEHSQWPRSSFLFSEGPCVEPSVTMTSPVPQTA